LHVVDAAEQPVACVAWDWKVNDRQARLHVLTGRGLPITSAQQGQLLKLVGRVPAGCDQPGAVECGPGTFVRRRGRRWIRRGGKLFGWSLTRALVTVCRSTRSTSVVRAVGQTLRPAPWSMLRVWPAARLSRAAAGTVRALDAAATDAETRVIVDVRFEPGARKRPQGL
jgi:hypothetical protein